MSKLESALVAVRAAGNRAYFGVSGTAIFVVTLAYLVAMLSVPLSAPEEVIWFGIYPVAQSEMLGVGYGKVLLRSLWVLPIIVCIGIFNPIIDTATAFTIGDIDVNEGWVSLTGIVLRGLFAFQAVILLTMTSGVYEICNSMRKIGCPKILTTQILFTYRYITVVMEETLNMDRARKARGFGKSKYPVKMWGRMIGQLLVRSMDRAQRINRAMLARGFTGEFPENSKSKMDAESWILIVFWISIFFFLRFIPLSKLITQILAM